MTDKSKQNINFVWTVGANQVAILALGLTLTESILIDYLAKAQSWADHKTDGESVYYHLQASKIHADLIGVFDTRKTIQNLLSNLIKKGMVDRYTVEKRPHYKVRQSIAELVLNPTGELLKKAEIAAMKKWSNAYGEDIPEFGKVSRCSQKREDVAKDVPKFGKITPEMFPKTGMNKGITDNRLDIDKDISYVQQSSTCTHQQAADSSRPSVKETSGLVSRIDDIFDCEWFAGSADAEASSKDSAPNSSHEPLAASQEVAQEAKKAPKNTAKTDKKASSRRFVPPTYADVAAYCLERANGINAEHFVDFYESKGWMIGANKMVSWQGAVRTWEQKRKDIGLVPTSRPVKQRGEIWFSQDCKTKEEFEQRASDQADRVLAMMEQFGFSN